MKQKETLRITLVQATLAWEDPVANHDHFEKLLKRIRKGTTDLILLPEMFNTGFTMNTLKCAQTMKGVSVEWMKERAKEKNAVVCGSAIIEDRGNYYNRLLWADPKGTVKHYDKRHLFRMAGEHHHFSQGDERKVFLLHGWKVFPMVCYDLRFPVWSRNDKNYDLILYVANWPARRKFAWSSLLVARAIENQCYVAGLNRVGFDGKKIHYSGNSVILDALGKSLSAVPAGKETVQTVKIKYSELKKFRKSFPVHMDADRFRIIK